jgi:hypothetical protein
MTTKTNLKAGKLATNHNEALQVRSSIKAGGLSSNNHNEKLVRVSERQTVSMRRELLTTSRKDDRLELLIVRAGLRAGKRFARARVRE